jgi:hypothetical protein
MIIKRPFHRPRGPPCPLVALTRCLRSCLPACLVLSPWRTPRSGTPWAPRALETIPCHASAPAAGVALSAAGRPQARSQGTDRTDGW